MSLGRSLNKLGKKGFRRERPQPIGRRFRGFLEHHKDYVLRAKNKHKKEDEIQRLRLLASLKNPDEFHSDMVHTEALNGKLFINKESKMNAKRMKIYRDNDNKYMTMRLQHEQNKLKRELNSFHCIDAATLIDKNKGNGKRNKNKMEIVESSNSKDVMDKKKLLIIKNKPERKADHIIFVDNDDKRKAFDASTYFGTPKQLIHQKSNRLKTSQLANGQIKIDLDEATKLKKQTLLKYWQIQGRIKRVEDIKKYKQDLNLKRKIHSGDRYLVYKKRNIYSGKIVKKRYKWPKERKR